MAQVLRPVFIGELVVSANPEDVLVAYGLGSCVVVCLYDPLVRVGGMLHALLPTNRAPFLSGVPLRNGTPLRNGADTRPTKFVDQGVPLLIAQVLDLGAKSFRLVARLCGGANMLAHTGLEGRADHIGQLNIQAAESALRSARVRLRASATGGRGGRTVKLHMADGRVTVKTLKESEYVLES